MDHKRSNPEAIGRNKPNQNLDSRYHRAYKACISCRNKKSKCSITAEDYTAGLACSKCRREMRPCIFPSERHGPRRLSTRGSKEHNEIPMGSDASGRLSYDVHTARTPSVQSQSSHETHFASVGTDLTGSMITTALSNGNDALNLLFEAAQNEERDINTSYSGPSAQSVSAQIPISPNLPTAETSIDRLPELSMELLDTWNAYRFVRMRWLSAEEIVWLLDMFFKNMAPLSPILDDFYADHANHYLLVTHEPMLTCLILIISLRYHTLPSVGGHSRGYSIHQRLWDHFQHLLMRLVLGLEKYSKAKTRTLGTIEALLLLTEWHPRSLYGPPPSDGWDSDILFTVQDRRDQCTYPIDNPSRTRWREDVIEPAHRSDRMSWMVISCAISLGNELGIFDEQAGDENVSEQPNQHRLRILEQRSWLAKLLYVYQEQLSSRLGRRPIMAPGTSHAAICATNSSIAGTEARRAWAPFIVAWTRLTKIVRSISDLLFPSASATNQIIRSGRYTTITEHIESLLSAWSKDSQELLSSGTYLADLLILEYESTRVHTYALGLQAIVSRTLADTNASPAPSATFHLTPTDYRHVQEVTSSTLTTLRTAIRLYDKDFLRFCPIRTFLHITTASIFLLKGLSLGVSPRKLNDSLEVLSQTVVALKCSNPDDLHVGGRYATLLEMHMAGLQKHFVPTLQPHNITSLNTGNGQQSNSINEGGVMTYDFADCMDGIEVDGLDNSWLSLPPDSGLLSFSMDNFQGLQCLEDDTLDFLWNLGK